MSRVALVLSTVATIAVGGCAGIHSADTHFARAKDAMRDGDLDRAEKELADARYRADNAWGHAMYERERGRVRIARTARALAELRASTATTDLAAARTARQLLATVRTSGGDAALERELAAELDRRADRIVADAERASANDVPRFGPTLHELRAYGLSAPVASRVRQQLARVVATHRGRATTAATPLARHAHLGFATLYEGHKPAYADSALMQPFTSSVAVSLAGAPCPALAKLLPSSSWEGARRIELSVDVRDCKLVDNVATNEEKIEWTEQGRLLRTERKTTKQRVCSERTIQMATFGYTCSRGAMMTSCSTATQSVTVPVCREVTTVQYIPIYEQIEHSAVRTVTRRSSELYVRGSFTARLGDATSTGSFSVSDRSSSVSAPAAGDRGPLEQGRYSPASDLWSRHKYEVQWRVDGAVREVLAVDARRFVAAAEGATGSDELREDAWLQAVLAGAKSAGTWHERYGVSADQLVSIVRGYTSELFAVAPLPAVTTFTIPPRPADKIEGNAARQLT